MALVFEPPEPDVLRRPPRPPRERIFTRSLWIRTALAGVVMAAGTLALFRLELHRGASLAQAQSVALTTLILFQSFQLANVRSERRSIVSSQLLSNPFLLVSALVALGVAPIPPETWPVMVLAATSVVIAVELHKAWLRRSPSRPQRDMPA